MHRLNMGTEQPQIREPTQAQAETGALKGTASEQDISLKTNPEMVVSRQKLSLLRSKKSCNARKSRVKAKNLVWTEQDQKMLFEFQNQYGNCWSVIARKLNRPDNSVKNRYYSMFRKSVRHINKFIKKYCHRQQLKILTNANMLAILAACQESNAKSLTDPTLSTKCKEIKMKMLEHAADPRSFQKEKIVELIKAFYQVCKLIKLLKNQYTEELCDRIDLREEGNQQDSQAERQVQNCQTSNTTSPQSLNEHTTMPMFCQEYITNIMAHYNGMVPLSQPYAYYPYQTLFYNPTLVYLPKMNQMPPEELIRNSM